MTAAEIAQTALETAPIIVTAAAAIAAITPTPKDDIVLIWVRKIIDFLALNFGNAKNAKTKEN